jgi:hypothetical protein
MCVLSCLPLQVTASTGGVLGYEGIDISYDGGGWGGLEYNGNQALLDGSVNNGGRGWFYAIGSGQPWGPNACGIPGAHDCEQQVELYVLWGVEAPAPP